MKNRRRAWSDTRPQKHVGNWSQPAQMGLCFGNQTRNRIWVTYTRPNCRNSGLVFEPAETTQEHVGPSKRYWRAWIQLCTHAVVLTHDGTLNRMICKHRALIHGKSLGCREVWWYSGDVTGQDVDTRYYSRPQAILTNMSAPLWLNHTCWFILSLFLQILRVDYLPQGFSRSWYPLRFSRQRTGSNASFLSIQTGCFYFVRVASGEV